MKVNRQGTANIFTDEQVQKLVKVSPIRYATLWVLMLHTAARVGEATLLTWGDVKGGVVHFKKQNTKCKTTRQVKMHPALQAQLEAFKDSLGREVDDKEYIFHSRLDTHKPISTQAVDLKLRALTTDLFGLGWSCHSFRRTKITRVARQVGLPAARNLSGHKNLAGLTPYIEVTAEEEMAAVMA